MGQDQTNYRSAFIFLSLLFFMWGFITCLNDLLIPQLKEVFELSYWQAMLIQTAFFGAYFIVSLIYFSISITRGDPIARIGYQKGLVLGLLICGVGCLGFLPAANLESYPVFLIALFILASGVTLIQIAANPYVAILGPAQTASSRLNLAQGLNSLGYTIAPVIGGALLFSGIREGADAVKVPYIGLAVVFVLLALLFSRIKLPVFKAKDPVSASAKVLQHPHFVMGMIAIFAYVGAEVAVGSIFINYLGLEDVMGYEKNQADKFLAFYWGGLMIGRFIGAISLSDIAGKTKLPVMLLAALIGASLIYFVSYKDRLTGEILLTVDEMLPYLGLIIVNLVAFRVVARQPGKMIGVFAVFLITCLLGTILFPGVYAMWAIIGIGLFNSIMWSNIFSLSIEGLGDYTGQGSSLLVMMIVGGALIPPIQGYMADLFGVRNSFWIIFVCYAYLAYFGFFGHKLGKQARQNIV